MNDERLEHLLDLYFDEALKAEEQAELERLLLSQPQARELFWKRARFHSLLRRRGRENWGRRLAMEQAAGGAPASVPVPRWRVLGETWRRALQPAGGWRRRALRRCCCFSRGIVRVEKCRRNPTANANADLGGKQPAEFGGAQHRSAELARGGNDLARGGGEMDGEQRTAREHPRAGLAEVRTRLGGGAIPSGRARGDRSPAEFELINDMQARCLLGKVRAEVPPRGDRV
jgi:hypothetical protein